MGLLGVQQLFLAELKKKMTKTKLAACHKSDSQYFSSLFKIKKNSLSFFCFNHFHPVCQYLKMPFCLHLSRFIVSLYKERSGDGWVAY